MTRHSTLSQRGNALKAQSQRAQYEGILMDPYDPVERPDGFVNIGTAENYNMVDDVTKFTEEKLDLSKLDFTYGHGPWGTERLTKAVARHMTKYFKAITPIDHHDILVTNGVTPLCEMLGFTLGDANDAVLFTAPIYQAFESDFGLKAQVTSVFAELDTVDPVSVASVAKYEEALQRAMQDGTRVRALMLCNPHNPLGICYPKETIIELMKLCQKYHIHLLSDEIYATSVYQVSDSDAIPFTSVLSFDTKPYIDDALLHVIYGMSKDLAAGGLRVGFFHTRSKELMTALGAMSHFYWAALPSQQIAATMLEDDEWMADFIEKSNERLATSNSLSRGILDSKKIKYRTGSNAGFFLWVDLRPFLRPSSPHIEPTWDDEAALVKRMLDKKVFLIPGQMLHAPAPGYFRLIFSEREATMREGLKRLFEVLGV